MQCFWQDNALRILRLRPLVSLSECLYATFAMLRCYKLEMFTPRTSRFYRPASRSDHGQTSGQTTVLPHFFVGRTCTYLLILFPDAFHCPVFAVQPPQIQKRMHGTRASHWLGTACSVLMDFAAVWGWLIHLSVVCPTSNTWGLMGDRRGIDMF